ncbi:MAG: hypothetical protein HY901_17280, partial [Deltaproteobacteria bacterium]|nr:hypothetical protein [Deltaproteobacteria bacterium]
MVNLNIDGKHLWLRQSEDGSSRAIGQHQATTNSAAWWMVGGSVDQPLGVFHGFLWVLDYSEAKVVA